MSNINLKKYVVIEVFIWVGLVAFLFLTFWWFPSSNFYTEYAFIKDPRGSYMYTVLPLTIAGVHLFLFLHIWFRRSNELSALAYIILSLIVLVCIIISVFTLYEVHMNFFKDTSAVIFMRAMIFFATVLSRYIVLGLLKSNVKLFKDVNWKLLSQAAIPSISLAILWTANFYPVFILLITTFVATAPSFIEKFLASISTKVSLFINNPANKKARYSAILFIVLLSAFGITCIDAEAAAAGKGAGKELAKILGGGLATATIFEVARAQVDVILNPPVEGVSVTYKTDGYIVKCKRPSVTGSSYGGWSGHANAHNCNIWSRTTKELVTAGEAFENMTGRPERKSPFHGDPVQPKPKYRKYFIKPRSN